MNAPTKTFADKLFVVGFQIGFWLFRRSPVKAAPPVGTTRDWFAPTGHRRTWEAALSGAAHHQQANQPID